MAIEHLQTFDIYASTYRDELADEGVLGSPSLVGTSDVISGVNYGLGAASRYYYAYPTWKFDDRAEVCFSFEYFLQSSSHGDTTLISFTDEAEFDRMVAEVEVYKSPKSGLWLSSQYGDLIVNHSIRTGSNSPNTVTVATAELGLLSKELYAVDVKLSFGVSTATIVIYVNGTKVIDTTFDPERLVTGYEMKSVGAVTFGPGYTGSGQTGKCYVFPGFVRYADDAQTPFPIGPVHFETIWPTDAGLRTGMPYTASYANVDMANGSIFDFDAAQPGSDIVLASMIEARFGARDGTQVARARAEVQDGVNAVLSFGETSITPAFRDIILKLPFDVSTVSEVDATKLSVTSVPVPPEGA